MVSAQAKEFSHEETPPPLPLVFGKNQLRPRLGSGLFHSSLMGGVIVSVRGHQFLMKLLL